MDWVVVVIDDRLFEGDDRVVGDVDMLGADFRAALGDVAEADTCLVLKLFAAVQVVGAVQFW